jgi:hypothetical protein
MCSRVKLLFDFPKLTYYTGLFLILEKRPFTADDGLSEVNKMPGQKPVAKFKAGQISAAIWENEISVNGGKTTVMKATVQRRYKDNQGSWKSSGSFSRNEIPLAVYCLQKSFEKIIEMQIDEGSENGAVEEEVPL